MVDRAEARAGRDRVPGFEPVQREILRLFGRGGALSRLDFSEGTVDGILPKVDLRREDLDHFGRNAIVTHTDGTREIIHQGRKFIVNKNGTIQGDRTGSVIKDMKYDFANKTITFDNGKVRLVFDPRKDTTTIEPKVGNKKIEINRNGVIYFAGDRPTKFLAHDRSFSVSIDDKGIAKVADAKGKPLPAGHPHRKLMDLDGQKVDISPDGRSLTIAEGGGKRTFYPGSHSYLTVGGELREVQTEAGKYTLKKAGGKLDIETADGFTYRDVDPKTVKYGEHGRFSFTTAGKRLVEVDPVNKLERRTRDGREVTTYFDAPGRSHEVTMERDGRGNWGVTGVWDERGVWRCRYKGDSRKAQDLLEIELRSNGKKRSFKIGEGNVDGLDVSPAGQVTVRFKGEKEKYAGFSYKPGLMEEVHTGFDKHNVKVKYEKVGKFPDDVVRAAQVSDGRKTFSPVYAADEGRRGLVITGLKDERGVLVHSTLAKGDAASIILDPETKGFKLKLKTGQELEIDPSRRSERLTTIKGDKRTTLERFADNHWVVTETNGKGPKLVRAFSDTTGGVYRTAYVDEKNPEKGVKVTLRDGTTPIPEVLRYKATVVGVTDDGVIKLTAKDPAKKDVSIDKLPDGRKVIAWKDGSGRGETRDRFDLVIDTTTVRDGKPAGTIIDRAPAFGAGFNVRELTLKGTGETFTYDPATRSYIYRNQTAPEKRGTVPGATIQADANGNILVNGINLGSEPTRDQILLAARPPAGDPRRRFPGEAPDALEARRRAIVKNIDGFKVAAVLAPPRDGAILGDGSTVERTKDFFGNTTTTTIDGVTGRQIRYTQDVAGRLVRAENPDGRVWLRVRDYRSGVALWREANTGQLSLARTEGNIGGQKFGLDEFGVLKFRLYGRGPWGLQGVNLVCLRNYTNLYSSQYEFFKRNGFARGV